MRDGAGREGEEDGKKQTIPLPQEHGAQCRAGTHHFEVMNQSQVHDLNLKSRLNHLTNRATQGSLEFEFLRVL